MQSEIVVEDAQSDAGSEAGYVFVRVPREVLPALDAFVADEPDRPQRADAIRRILRDWLIEHQYLDLRDA